MTTPWPVGLGLVGDLVGVGDERDLLEELLERACGTDVLGLDARRQLAAGLLELGGTAVVELLGDGDELGEVLDAGLVLRVVARPQLGEVAALARAVISSRAATLSSAS